ncbi:FG-GAP-like repeat-containing protein [Pseudaestuariivita atlantica]|uniref:FG-GAP-like repeat-containing protein n=1 Tax=Pseudaestuariivita atlantica TaxID=1317121 RepID=UPI0009E3D2D9
MMKARRQPSRPWPARARRALCRPGLWLAVSLAAVAPGLAASDPVEARYAEPTTRYPHGVLGDDVENAALEVVRADGRVLRLRWPDTIVFEDTAPRLADLDGDGKAEVIVVESHERQGARLAVYGIFGDVLALRAATPFIGTRFRWLAVVGAGDLDGDGVAEIAYVDRPHLAKTLRIWRYAADGATVTLAPVGALPGVTNHRIGEVDIAGGLRDCGAGPEMIVASADWRRVLALTFDGSDITQRDLGAHAGRGSFATALECGDLPD